MDKVNITDVQGRIIAKLSKGYKQRVGIAQALLNDPPVLILDEPTIGLDPKQIHEVRELVKGLAGNHTVFCPPHSSGSRADLPSGDHHRPREDCCCGYSAESQIPEAGRGPYSCRSGGPTACQL